VSLALRFLGVGSAQAPELGSACGVIERDGAPLLMIDCGPEALSAYLRSVGQAWRAGGHVLNVSPVRREVQGAAFAMLVAMHRWCAT